jgi:saccharopine dehydrogenase (NAD+, L-lysine-forming)
MDETRRLDVAALLDHDIMVNAVYVAEPDRPFLTPADLDREAEERRLTVVSDVSCDVTSACNRLPINAQVTSWAQPVRRLRTAPRPLDVLAIDNLPSLLPKEASSEFSADLLPWVKTLPQGGPSWSRCQDRFREACRQLARKEGVSAI